MQANTFRIYPKFLLLLGFLVMFYPTLVLAESLMYIDESGNILFAESLSQVPERYKNQVVKRPTFSGDPRAKKAWMDEIAKRQRDAEVAKQHKAEQVRRDEEARKRKEEADKKQLDQQKKGFFDRAKTSPKAGRTSVPGMIEIPGE